MVLLSGNTAAGKGQDGNCKCSQRGRSRDHDGQTQGRYLLQPCLISPGEVANESYGEFNPFVPDHARVYEPENMGADILKLNSITND